MISRCWHNIVSLMESSSNAFADINVTAVLETRSELLICQISAILYIFELRETHFLLKLS